MKDEKIYNIINNILVDSIYKKFGRSYIIYKCGKPNHIRINNFTEKKRKLKSNFKDIFNNSKCKNYIKNYNIIYIKVKQDYYDINYKRYKVIVYDIIINYELCDHIKSSIDMDLL